MMSALLLAAAASCQCPSVRVRHLVWPFAVMSALLTVFALEEGISRSVGRPANHYNELPLRNVIPTTQEAPLQKIGLLSPFAQILSGSYETG